MCPCISSRSKYALCSRYESGLRIPSTWERANYCFDVYELCPLFYNSRIKEGLKKAINESNESEEIVV